MENWLIYALISTFCIGMTGYFQKIQAENQEISNNSFLFYNYFAFFFFPLISILVLGKDIIFSLEIISFAFLLTIIYSYVIRTRIESLKYVDTSTYFINFRIFSSILLIIFGQIFFAEIITIQEYVGIILGILTFYLLLEKKFEKEKQSNFMRGLIFIAYGIILITVLQLIVKYFVVSGMDIYSLLFFEGIFGMLLVLITKKRNSVKNIVSINGGKNILFLGINGVFFCYGAYFNMLAFETGDVAIVYKIISYSLFIPIILSILFYKEKVTVKKLLAFVLTVISILLFV